MTKERFTGAFSWSWLLIACIFLFFLALAWWPGPRGTVQAQFAGQPVFNVSFTVNATRTAGAREYFTIPNRGQLAETITYSLSNVCSTSTGITLIEFEGSNDNNTWFALASSVALGASAGSAVMQSNGYFNFKRLSFPACDSGDLAVSFTGVYTGYGIALPINQVASETDFILVQAAQALGPGGYYLVQGFQCYNPNPTVAYVNVAGVGVGVPANQEINYQGPAFLGTGLISTVKAVTTPSGSTPVSTPVPCNFELSAGPFYPFLPSVTY
jgi:hypothetical protein